MKQTPNKSHSLKFIIFIILMGMSTVALFSQDKEKEFVSIGIVLDGKWEGDDDAIRVLREQAALLLSEEYNAVIPDSKILSGDWSIGKIKSSMEQLLDDPEIDIVIGIGEHVSRILPGLDKIDKPVITTITMVPDSQKMTSLDNSLYQYVNKILIFPSFGEQISSFKSLVNFHKAVVLLGELSFYNSNNQFDEKLLNDMTVEGVELSFISAGSDPDKVLEKIPADAQAIIIEPLRFLSIEQVHILTEKLKQSNLPVFTVFDEKYVHGNVLAGIISDDFMPRLGRRIAINIQRILSGEKPSEISMTFPFKAELVINMQTAKRLKVYPTWNVMANARTINDATTQPARKLTLSDVTKEALEVNLDLLAQKKNVEAGFEDVSIARSYLLPQVNTSITGLWVDENKAESSFGMQPERSIFTNLTLNQIIYDEKTWANLSVNESRQIIREYELEQEKLDIILESAVGYLNVLRAKSFEKIQTENLNRTKANLEIANYRYSVGSGRLSETYRWESELATNKKSVIESNSNRNLAEINLNKILNRPLEEQYTVDESDLVEVMDEITGENISKYFANKWYFKTLRDFIVEEGLAQSPEIKIINEAITIQERVKTSSGNSLFLPTIALQGELNNNFYKGGAGSEGMNLSIPGSVVVPEQKDFYWTVALNLSFDLFDGGAKFAELEKSEIELSKLQIEKESLENIIEQNIRGSLHQSGSSYAGIEEANKSSEAANKNLELVVEAYSTGAASIVDLIDAQNSALVANQLAVDAVYDFLIDLLRVERSMGKFYYSLDETERQSFLERLEVYIHNNLEY